MMRKPKTLFIVIFVVVFFIILKSIFDSREWGLIEKELNYEFVRHSRSVFDFDYILESPPCTPVHNIIMIITSYAGHVELRSAHRRAFSSNDLEKLGIKRVFLLAKFPTVNRLEISQQSIENEQLRFEDLVQGDFNEAYRNLTLKHIMGLRWASTKCSDVDFIIKMDDDIVFNIHIILKQLENSKIYKGQDFLMGYVLIGTKPIRLKENKWYVTKSEYPKSFYPPFLSGWMYFTTTKTAAALVAIAQQTTYFWIDDVYVTEYFELMDCCINDMMNKNIMCEYAVGPNGNDNNLIVKFNNAINACNLNKCVNRTSDKSLNDTCVSIKKSFPISKGIPVINLLKL